MFPLFLFALLWSGVELGVVANRRGILMIRVDLRGGGDRLAISNFPLEIPVLGYELLSFVK